jgi:uncharacterized membrane protein (UPF0127 family)
MSPREEFHKAEPASRRTRFAALALLVSIACAGGQEQASRTAGDSAADPGAGASVVTGPRPPAGHAWIIFGADTVLAEVAATPDERAEGLMYRDAVPDGTGMLFVFPDVAVRGFWMQNTYVPLDLAFMDPSFNIVDIVQMQPLDTATHDSRAPFMYGLEVRQGWLSEHGIEVGARAEVVFGVQSR